MTEADLKAFLEWADSNVYELAQHFPRQPKVNFAFNAWLAALAHSRKDVAELVEAVEAIDVVVRVGPDASPVVDADRLERAKKLAAKLKEQP